MNFINNFKNNISKSLTILSESKLNETIHFLKKLKKNER